MRQNASGAALCILLSIGLAALVSACGGVPEAMSQTSDDPDVGKYIEGQLAFVPDCSQDDLARRYVPVQVLAINDFHGQLGSGKTVSGRPVGSAPVLAAYLRSASAGMEGNTIIVSAGDIVGASPPQSALLQDEPTIMFFNLLGNKYCNLSWPSHPHNNLAAVPGNHEFDDGKDELLRLIYGGNHANGPYLEDPWGGADFPCVCANIVHSKSGKPFLPPFVIKNIKGTHVALVGAILKDAPAIVTASGIEGLSFRDEVESINAYVRILKRHNIRAIVAVIHQGTFQAAYEGETDASRAPRPGPIVDIVKALDGEVDVVVSGHSHGFTNAFVPARDGRPVLVTQAWSAGTAYADIDMEIDRRTRNVISKTARIVTAWADDGPGLTPDAEAAALVKAAEDAVAPLTDRVVGTAADAITRARNGAGESALGNLVADAQRSVSDLASDFALMNPGGIRTDIHAGEVTWGELFAVQPFNNYLVKMELTGQRIYDVLNQQWAGQTTPRVLQVSGLTYTWDSLRPAGDRIVEVRKEGAPIDKTAVYTVTVNSFLAEGGDNFTVLRDGTNRVVGPVDLDALVAYIGKLPQPFTASIEGRIVRLN
jgi:5'-nucleotidase